MAQGFKDTLNLPKTDFPMRANLPTSEPQRLIEWEKSDLRGRVRQSRAGRKSFILHDGPPYANGNIHMGHALNKVLKDIVVRYKTMRGFHSPYVPGWDCHGLPIEQQILKELGDQLHEMEPLALRNKCHAYALRWIDVQREQFKRLGITGEWETPYMTVSHQYEVGILKVLQALVERGLVRKGFKTVHWDPVFRTALAEAEIVYHAHKSPSIYVAMPLIDPDQIEPLEGVEEASLVIWTTTPWTMPANLGVSLHPEFDYVLTRTEDGRHLIVAEGLLERFAADAGLGELKALRKFKATAFEFARARHPFFEDVQSLVMLGEHVTLEQGTGCVHTAPGHGSDDFEIGRKYGLEAFCPVNEKGCYTSEFPEMEGEFVFKANPRIVERLREKGLLIASKTVEHEYPYSDRSKHPIIFRATAQWFMELAEGGVRERALEIIDNDVRWIPSWGQDRIRGMVERRPEWCLSRQRHWGVPIPSVRSKKTEKSILDPRVIANFIEAVKELGTDAWYSEPIERFVPADMVCPDTGETGPEAFEKEGDILDVWFDSGSSHVSVLELDERLESPADLYLEGSDQHRGWFQSALLTAVGARGHTPYHAVLTHGFVLDGEGKAMSKSVGNVISPLDLIEQYGADVLRLWVASTDYRNDVAISDNIMQITRDAYRTIRNSLRFQIGNLYDFDPQHDSLPVEDLLPLDRWALHELGRLVPAVTEAYDNYEFHRAFQLINLFYTVTLSARYHDFLKNRLYTFRADSRERRSAQTVIALHLKTLTKLLAPVLVFTTDEAHHEIAAWAGNGDPSIHLQDWPETPPEWLNPTLHADFEALLAIRDKVNEKLEALRTSKVIGKSEEAHVLFEVDPNHPDFARLKAYEADLPELFIVSRVSLNESPNSGSLTVGAVKAEGTVCPRCWRIYETLVPAEPEPVCASCLDALQHPEEVHQAGV